MIPDLPHRNLTVAFNCDVFHAYLFVSRIALTNLKENKPVVRMMQYKQRLFPELTEERIKDRTKMENDLRIGYPQLISAKVTRKKL
jgi:hypothetical protein